MISGADIMVKCLENEGVSIVFGYPGAAICPFYDSLFQSSIRHILVRQEQNSVHGGKRLCKVDRKAGCVCCNFRPGRYEPDYGDCHSVYRLYSHYSDNRPGQKATF